MISTCCIGCARDIPQRVVGMGGLTLYDRITDRHDPSERGDAGWSNDNWPPLSQKGLNPIIDVEDVSMMLMHLDNGVFCSYQQCHYTPDSWRNYTIIGTEGRLENLGEDFIAYWNKRKTYDLKGQIEIPVPEPEGSHGGADPRIVAEFVRFVTRGREDDHLPYRRAHGGGRGVSGGDVHPQPEHAV